MDTAVWLWQRQTTFRHHRCTAVYSCGWNVINMYGAVQEWLWASQLLFMQNCDITNIWRDIQNCHHLCLLITTTLILATVRPLCNQLHSPLTSLQTLNSCHHPYRLHFHWSLVESWRRSYTDPAVPASKPSQLSFYTVSTYEVFCHLPCDSITHYNNKWSQKFDKKAALPSHMDVSVVSPGCVSVHRT